MAQYGVIPLCGILDDIILYRMFTYQIMIILTMQFCVDFHSFGFILNMFLNSFNVGELSKFLMILHFRDFILLFNWVSMWKIPERITWNNKLSIICLCERFYFSIQKWICNYIFIQWNWNVTRNIIPTWQNDMWAYGVMCYLCASVCFQPSMFSMPIWQLRLS